MRLQRVGRKNRPTYRVVLIDSRRAAKSGGFQEILGSHDRIVKQTTLNNERIKHWLNLGVATSPAVHNLLISQGLIEGKKIPVHALHASKKTMARKAAEKSAASAEKPSETVQEDTGGESEPVSA